MPEELVGSDFTATPAEPVRFIPQDAGRTPETGMGLCLSGGGYRAMLFHLGALWRLNEAGLLPRLARISSVSGGSITAGVLGMNWSRLEFDAHGTAQRFMAEVVGPVRRMASRSIDISAILGGLLLPGSASDRVASAYRRHLFGNATLQSLPDAPRFVFNATNVQTGSLWRFSKPYMADYRVGMILNPEVLLATAVSASSAFPPFLSPVSLDLTPFRFEPDRGADLQRAPFTSKAVLTDGGVYDNLGIETVWKRYRTVLVSDAGGSLAADSSPSRDWGRHAMRVLFMIDNQVRSLRKRQIIEAFKDKKDPHDGAYWGIRSQIADYHVNDGLPCPPERIHALAQTPTRLSRIEPDHQERLINWGYAICDAAIRKHVDTGIAAPRGFPFPHRGV